MDTPTSNGVLEEFRLEFSRCWSELPHKSAFFVLTGFWVVLFQFLGNSTLGYANTPSLFGYLYNAFISGGQGFLENEESYAVLVPFVVAGLFWHKRGELLQLPLRCWQPGLLILVGGTLLHLLGYTVQQPRLSVLGFFVGLYGIMGTVWGAGWLRASFFPFILFGFCVPIGSLAEPITFRLRLLVSALVGFVSHYLLAIDVIVQGNMLIDPTGHYQYEVAAACSGIRSLIATVALAVILAFIRLQNPWKRLLLVIAAVPLAVLGNLIRMMTIIIAAEFGGQSVGTYVHDGGPLGLLSLLPYIPAFAGLLLLEHYLRSEPSLASAPCLDSLKLKET
jgi:exosortase